MTKKLWLKVTLIVVMFVLLLCSGLYYLKHSNAVISSVEIKSVGSLHYVSKDALIEIIKPYQRFNWFYIDVHKTAKTISAYPGIDKVKVEKYWPNRLVIEINEIKAIAYWQNQPQLLLSNQEIITPKQFITTEKLPVFHGDIDQKKAIVKQYDKLNSIASSQGFSIIAIYYQSNQWHIILAGGVEIMLGSNDVENKLDMLLKNFSAITIPKGKKIAGIDVRYHTGFAVELAEK